MAQRSTKVIIIGATGAVGRELTRLFAADGVQVHAVGRDPERLAALAAEHGAKTYPVDLTDAEQTAAAATALHAERVPLAIAAVGGWYVAEPGLTLPLERWTATIDSNLHAHFVAARAFAPVLDGDRPVYLALNGIASHHPCEGSIAISVAGAGQRMMLDVLAAEGRHRPTAYAELVVDTPILQAGQPHPKDEPTHTFEQVYDAVLAVAERSGDPGAVARTHLG